MLEKLFQLSQNQTSARTEILAGITTFLTMSYILFINPTILSQAGMDKGAVFVATCLVAALGCILMGLIANYPIALAPGMALNTYFTYGVVMNSGQSWHVALGAVLISSLIFFFISISPLRDYFLNSIPKTLKLSIVAGIGLFLGFIGLKNAGIIIDNPATLVSIGHLHDPTTLLAILGFCLIVALDAIGVFGSIIIGILLVTSISILLGFNHFNGVFSLPPSIEPTFLQMDVRGALNLSVMSIIFAFLFVILFDNTGTMIGIAHRAGMMDENGKLPRVGRVMLADSLTALSSAFLGTSTTTNYLESSVGVKAGGRTGLMAVVVGILFLSALFFAPLANSIPPYATAPALIYVACLMTRALVEINWDDVTEFAPGIITAIMMPLTFSIAEGISFGFVSYALIKLLSGRYKELNPALIVLCCAFVLKFVFINH